MLREGPVPRFVHGIFEYLLGVFLVAAPFLIGYDDVGAALGVSMATGVAVLILAAVTEGPTGLVQQLPVSAHFAIDFLLAIFLIAAPFLVGFGDEPAPRNLFIALGVVHLLISIGTRFRDAVPKAESRSTRPAATGTATSLPPSAGSPTRPTTPVPRTPGPTPLPPDAGSRRETTGDQPRPGTRPDPDPPSRTTAG